MPPCFFALALLLVVSIFRPAPAAAASGPPNPVTVGNARFTVVTPNCVRLEYVPGGQFVDAPSLFAVKRAARGGFRLTRGATHTVINTGALRLTYTPDGKPFSPANLRADVRRGAVTWTPGAPNPGNLGGTIRTLDGAAGPEDLGQGLLSRDGWYLLDDSRSPLLLGGWVRARPAGSGTDWYLFGYGDDYRAALRSLAAIGGPVPLPRRYALGAWYSRYWPYSSADYRQIIGEYAAHDFPLDDIVMDMDWHRDGWTGWSWNRARLPDAEALLPWFHAQGLHVTLNLHPADGVGPQEDAYPAFMRDLDADPATKQTLPFDAADPRYMKTLFADVFTPLEKAGVDFWWLDWQQGERTRSVPDLTNLFWLNTLLYGRTSQGGQRGLSFSRWAGWGDHRHPIHFSGDASTSFPMLAFEVPFTSTAGNVGCFFWSHDIGGHNRGRNEESYVRWVQFGATSPVLRSHSTRDAAMDRRPWTYPRWAEDAMRTAFHLRDELFPYIYTSAAQSCRETVPLDRPLYVDYPNLEPAYHNPQEYLLGTNVLSAPVTMPGVGPGRVGRQTVWFPPGLWYDYFTGEQFEGGTARLVSADINEFPLYVRGGVPVPMQPYQARMAIAPLATLRVRCYPGADGQTGRSTLYEDDGVTTAYERGQSATTPLSYTRKGNAVTVTVGATGGHYAGQPARRALVVELPDTDPAPRVSVSGRPATAVYDVATSTNLITVPARPVGLPTVVTIRAGIVVHYDFHHQGGVALEVVPLDPATLAARAQNRRLVGILGTAAAGKTVRQVLATQGPTLPPDTQEALLALEGVGLVTWNNGVYGWGGVTQRDFYAPGGVLDAGTLTEHHAGKRRWLTASPDAASPLHGPAMSVAFRIAGREFRLPNSPLLDDNNVALSARVSANGSEAGYSPDGAIDGVPGGYPGDRTQEWSSGRLTGGVLRLDWDKPQTVDRILLYDRPNLDDQVTSGLLTFSDGTTLPVGDLPDDAKTPHEVRFPAKTVTWLSFTITGVKPTTKNGGLAEIAVYRAKTK